MTSKKAIFFSPTVRALRTKTSWVLQFLKKDKWRVRGTYPGLPILCRALLTRHTDLLLDQEKTSVEGLLVRMDETILCVVAELRQT